MTGTGKSGSRPALDHWYVNAAPEPGAAAGVVALHATDLVQPAPGSARRIGFDQAMHTDLPKASRVTIRVPGYRGKAFIPVLSWLVSTRLGAPDAWVTWLLTKQQGPKSLAAQLTALGWRDVTSRRDGALVAITGSLPAAEGPPPEPRGFVEELGGRSFRFDADYGVFSPDRVDDGTRLLAEVALQGEPVDAVADIGIGYGALAVSLVGNGRARRAVGTDVDCIALWLAMRNAAENGVRLDAVCTADPGAVCDTPLTVCNVPTHINAEQTAALIASLAHRARGGAALKIVVHRTLEDRYANHLRRHGLRLTAHHGEAHVVLEAVGS
jgi:16S rRNA (guanine1207-N2)-methyltransferase